MRKPIKVKENVEYKGYTIDIYVGDYHQGGKAIMFATPFMEPIATVTRWIKPLMINHVSIDINNMGYEIVKYLSDNNIIEGEFTEVIPSGYCDYPVYQLHQDVIGKIVETKADLPKETLINQVPPPNIK